MKITYNKIYKNIPKILCIIFSISLYIIFLIYSDDTDMYFEIADGRDILNRNFYIATHLNNFPRVAQQWLYSVCLALVDTFGKLGRVLFVLIQNIILIYLSSLFIYKKTQDKYKSIYGSFIALIMCNVYLINIRPQIITMILLVAEILLVEKYKETNLYRYILYTILLVILEANFHQSLLIYHIYILIPYYINKLFIPKTTKELVSMIDWKLILITPIYVLCSLCTPYKLEGALFIINTFKSNVHVSTNLMLEMNPMRINSASGTFIVLCLCLVIYLNYIHKSNIFINFYIFSIAYLSLINYRQILLLYIPILYIIAYVDFPTINSLNKYINNLKYYILIFLLIIGSMINTLDSRNNRINNYNSINIENIIPDKSSYIYDSDANIGGYLCYLGYDKVKFDVRLESYTKEVSGIPNLINEIYYIMCGHDITYTDFRNYYISDEELYNIIDDYDYVICFGNSYINKVLLTSTDWKIVYENNNINDIIWKHVS